MEAIFGVCSDGTILEVDLQSGQILKTVSLFQGQYCLDQNLVGLWNAEAKTTYDPLSWIIIQNRSSSRAACWACHEKNTFQIHTAASSFGNTREISSICISPCGRWLFRGLQNGSILITELSVDLALSHAPKLTSDFSALSEPSHTQWKHHLCTDIHLGAVTCISFNHFGWVATGGEDQVIQVAHISSLLSSSKNPSTLPSVKIHEHTLPITGVWLTDDNQIYSISRDQSLKFSDVSTQACFASITFPSALLCMAISKMEQFVYVGAQNGYIYKQALWRMTDVQSSNTSSLWTKDFQDSWSGGHTYDQSSNNVYKEHTKPVICLELSYDGSKLISSSLDGQLLIWDERTCRTIIKIQSPSSGPLVWIRLIIRLAENVQRPKQKESKKSNHSIPLILKKNSQHEIFIARGASLINQFIDNVDSDIASDQSILRTLTYLPNNSKIEELVKENNELRETNEYWKKASNRMLNMSISQCTE
ncbi:uncharacterized protein LOC126320382 [Schistocerca gregaria]|uniref:uncharacterized protein LOC126320382 n=1 Tax=Schistocerca gregaria TaxID=7010 RepID=UPI00211E7194|nr:uncharacterized protein LOC126320382 [Schistocerca gregaria]